MRSVNIMGVRGIPARHGGFETFAERLALFLCERGWEVAVYCQTDDPADCGREDRWAGITRIHFGTKSDGPVGTMEFDFKCVKHVLTRPGADLVLGYNTAIFNVLQRFKGRSVLMNMDGIEWRRSKWSLPAKIWFFINELVGANFTSLPIADHPEIAKHITSRSLKTPVMIPYGSDPIVGAPSEPLNQLGVQPDKYLVSIARIEPENSILPLVRAFSSRRREAHLVVLGNLDPSNSYHRTIADSASSEVIFPGAIYDTEVVRSLRFHARAYLHGHQVGGTNPSLVEALGAGNPIIAHDNRFNRWTAGEGQLFFRTVDECTSAINTALQSDEWVAAARQLAAKRHREAFQWDTVLSAYEEVLERHGRRGDN